VAERKFDLPWWTTDEVASAGGVSPEYIARLCRDARLECVKIKGVWFIWDDSARRWLASDRTPGPKPGSRDSLGGEQLELDLDSE